MKRGGRRRSSEEFKKSDVSPQGRRESFRTLADDSPDIIDRFDREMVHVYVNAAGARLRGVPAEAVLGRTIEETGVPEAFARTWRERIRRVFETGQPEDVEDTFPAEGGTRHFHCRMVPEFAGDGAVDTVLVVSRDITDRKRMEEELRRSREEPAARAGPEALRRNRQLSVLNAIGKAATRVLNLRERLLNALDTALESLDADGGLIFLLEPDAETLAIWAHRGVSEEFAGSLDRIKRWEGISGVAIGEKKPVVVDKCPDPRLAVLIQREGFGTLAAVPLVCGGDVVGSLVLMARRSLDFPADDLKMLESIGQLLGQSVRNARLHEEIQQELLKRANAESALRESESTLRSFFDNSPYMMGVVELRGDDILIVSDNLAAAEFFGAAPELMRGRLASELGAPEPILLEWVRHFRESGRTGRPVQFEYVHGAGGIRRIFLATVSRIHAAAETPQRFCFIVEEVTENRIAAERIRKALEIETALRAIDASIIAGDDLRRTLQLICDAIVEMGYRMCWFGLAQPDHTVRPVASRGFEDGYLDRIKIRWDDTPEGRGPTGTAIRTGRTFPCEDIQTDDRFLPWREEALKRGYRSSVAIPVVSEKSGVIGCFTVYGESGRALPKEEIHRLETFARQCTVAILNARRVDALRDADQRLAFHVSRMPLAYIVWDKDFQVMEWNPAAERIFGWKVEEAFGKHPQELIVPADARDHVNKVWQKLLEGDETSYSLDANIRKDGTNITCEWFNAPLRDAGGRIMGVLSMVHDVTEKTQLERQLQTAQRMEAVGTLAGGIAHDFNNALTGIFGFAEMLKAKLSGNERALSDINEIFRCAERASTLTRQLLTYSRRQIIEPVNLSLNKVLTDLMKLVSKVVGEHIEIRTFLAKDLPTVRADVGQIEQVIMNLVLNARDAMPGGGQLLLETGLVNLDAEYVRYHPYMSVGRYVVLTVSDTGIGMDSKTQEHVFDPFFTTKTPDKGTGLGLAMVYGIVKQHNGFIHLYSEPGLGTSFKIYLPPVDGVPDEIPSFKPSEIRGGTESILLAEDDESVRMLVDRTLKDLGYTVFVARNGEDAVALFKENQSRISLALLDVVMPLKGGKEAYEAMHRMNPGLKVIFMSGYTANAIHESFVLITGVPFLAKPFGPEALARKVREILDRDL